MTRKSAKPPKTGKSAGKPPKGGFLSGIHAVKPGSGKGLPKGGRR